MPPAAERSRTALRSLVATLEVVAFAAGAHLLAGGQLPDPGFLLAFGAVVLAGARLSIGRRLPPAVVAGLVLAAQVGLHATLEAVGPAHTAMAMAPMHTYPLQLSPQMIWAHLVTTVVTAIVLLCQERVLAVLTTFLRDLVAEPVPAGPRGRRPVVLRVAGVRRALLGVSPRRGPPVALLTTS